jgi:acetyl-CoA C-acetyltransferase
MDNPVIVSAVRTPIGKFLGTLSGIQAPRLGALAVKEAVLRAGLKPEQIDEVIMGNVVGPDSARTPRARPRFSAGSPTPFPR